MGSGLHNAVELQRTLEYELKQAEQDCSKPALLYLVPNEPSLTSRISGILLDLHKVNFGTSENLQFPDYVATYADGVAVLFTQGKDHIDKIADNLFQELSRRLRQSDTDVRTMFKYVGRASYKGSDDSAMQMLERAAQQ